MNTFTVLSASRSICSKFIIAAFFQSHYLIFNFHLFRSFTWTGVFTNTIEITVIFITYDVNLCSFRYGNAVFLTNITFPVNINNRSCRNIHGLVVSYGYRNCTLNTGSCNGQHNDILTYRCSCHIKYSLTCLIRYCCHIGKVCKSSGLGLHSHTFHRISLTVNNLHSQLALSAVLDFHIFCLDGSRCCKYMNGLAIFSQWSANVIMCTCNGYNSFALCPFSVF